MNWTDAIIAFAPAAALYTLFFRPNTQSRTVRTVARYAVWIQIPALFMMAVGLGTGRSTVLAIGVAVVLALAPFISTRRSLSIEPKGPVAPGADQA